MRYCDNCGYKLRADDAFCQQCGRKVEEMADTGPGSHGAGHPQKNKNKVPAILISAVLILCIGGLIAWYVLKPVDNSLTEQTAKKRAKETDHAEEGEDRSRGEEDGIAADSAVTIELTAEPPSLGPYHKVPVASSGASSVVEQEGHDNTASMTLAGLEETSWQAGVPGPGVGGQIWYELEEKYEIRYLSLKLGNWRGSSYYAGNHRPRVLRITVGNETADVTFPDGMEEYWVTLSSPCDTDSITLEIRDVYEGNKWDDTCIAEVGIYGE